MHFLRLAGLLFVPVLLHAGFLNVQLSATCGTTTVTASSGSATCSGPGEGMARAEGNFGEFGAGFIASAGGTLLDVLKEFSATASIQAAYQITFSGPAGPGYMEATVCLAQDNAFYSASLITPNGSMNWQSGSSVSHVCLEPGDTLIVPIVFGTPLDIQLSMEVRSGPVRCCGRLS